MLERRQCRGGQLRGVQAQPGSKLGVHHRGQRRVHPGRVRSAHRGDLGADDRAFGPAGDPGGVPGAEAVQARQELPLVLMRFQRREIEEHRQPVPAAPARRRRGDEVPDPALGQYVLVGERAVIRAQIHRPT